MMNRLVTLLFLVMGILVLELGCSDPVEVPLGPSVDTLIIIENDTTIVIQFDTLVFYDSTVVVDTLIFNHYDTAYINLVDTVYINNPPDTDTVYVQLPPDTVIVESSPDTVFDTTFIQLPPDTVIQVVTIYDTTYIPIDNLLYSEKRGWILTWDKRVDTVELNNPPAGHVLLGFDRTVLGDKPSGKEPAVIVNGDTCFFSIFGDRTRMVWIGPLDLPENAKVAIEFTNPYYGSKVSSPQCHDFLEGNYWVVIRADSVNFR